MSAITGAWSLTPPGSPTCPAPVGTPRTKTWSFWVSVPQVSARCVVAGPTAEAQHRGAERPWATTAR
eukprot:2245582-Prorocentrum_lima.AAC.1